MDFLKILNAAFSVLSWLVILAIVWALVPWFFKIVDVVQKVHDLAR